MLWIHIASCMLFRSAHRNSNLTRAIVSGLLKTRCPLSFKRLKFRIQHCSVAFFITAECYFHSALALVFHRKGFNEEKQSQVLRLPRSGSVPEKNHGYKLATRMGNLPRLWLVIYLCTWSIQFEVKIWSVLDGQVYEWQFCGEISQIVEKN